MPPTGYPVWRVGPSANPYDPAPLIQDPDVGPSTSGETTSLYKTELCRSFMETNHCRYGIKCRFAHGLAELRPVTRHRKYKTEKCKNFSREGRCPYGPRCRFIHDEDDETLKALTTGTPMAALTAVQRGLLPPSRYPAVPPTAPAAAAQGGASPAAAAPPAVGVDAEGSEQPAPSSSPSPSSSAPADANTAVAAAAADLLQAAAAMLPMSGTAPGAAASVQAPHQQARGGPSPYSLRATDADADFYAGQGGPQLQQYRKAMRGLSTSAFIASRGVHPAVVATAAVQQARQERVREMRDYYHHRPRHHHQQHYPRNAMSHQYQHHYQHQHQPQHGYYHPGPGPHGAQHQHQLPLPHPHSHSFAHPELSGAGYVPHPPGDMHSAVPGTAADSASASASSLGAAPELIPATYDAASSAAAAAAGHPVGPSIEAANAASGSGGSPVPSPVAVAMGEAGGTAGGAVDAAPSVDAALPAEPGPNAAAMGAGEEQPQPIHHTPVLSPLFNIGFERLSISEQTPSPAVGGSTVLSGGDSAAAAAW